MLIVTESDGSRWVSIDSLRMELEQLLIPGVLDESTLAANRTLQYLLHKLAAIQPDPPTAFSEPMERALTAVRAVGERAADDKGDPHAH